MNSQHPDQSLQHEGKMSMKERIEQSQAYGEAFRASHVGADQREAVKPLSKNAEVEDDNRKLDESDLPDEN